MFFLLVKYSTENSVAESNLFSLFLVASETSFPNRVMRCISVLPFYLRFFFNEYWMLNIPSH